MKLGLQTLELRRLRMDLVMCYKIVFGLTCSETSDFSRLVVAKNLHVLLRTNCLSLVQSLTLESISSVSVTLNHGTALTLLKRTLVLCWVWTYQVFAGSLGCTDLLPYLKYNLMSKFSGFISCSCEFCVLKFSPFYIFKGLCKWWLRSTLWPPVMHVVLSFNYCICLFLIVCSKCWINIMIVDN